MAATTPKAKKEKKDAPDNTGIASQAASAVAVVAAAAASATVTINEAAATAISTIAAAAAEAAAVVATSAANAALAIEEKAIAQASFNSLTIESLRGIRESTDRIEAKTDQTALRVDRFIEATNTSMKAVESELEDKVDTKDVGPIITRWHIPRSKFILAGGGVFVLIVTPVVVDHWNLIFERLQGLL